MKTQAKNTHGENPLEIAGQSGAVVTGVAAAAARVPDMTAGIALRASDENSTRRGGCLVESIEQSNLTATGFRAGVGGVTGIWPRIVCSLVQSRRKRSRFHAG